MRFGLVVSLLLAGVSAASAATNIYTISGGAPFGFSGQPDLVIGFHTTTNWVNVSISMPLEDLTTGGPLGGTEGTIYLVNQIGPGTTVTNQITSAAISGLTASFTTRTIFTGLSLPPGNYYLVMVPTSTGPGGLSLSPQGVTPVTVTSGTGVSDLGGGGSNAPLAGYPPATALCCGGSLTTPNNLAVTVTGDPGPPVTPAPPALYLILTALLAVGLFQMWRRRFAVPAV